MEVTFAASPLVHSVSSLTGPLRESPAVRVLFGPGTVPMQVDLPREAPPRDPVGPRWEGMTRPEFQELVESLERSIGTSTRRGGHVSIGLGGRAYRSGG